MKNTFAAALVLVCAVSFAQEKKAEMKNDANMKGAEMKGAEMKGSDMGQSGMAMWKPPTVTKGGDKKGLDDMFKAMDDAMKKGDMTTASSMIDFPVMMATDNSKGDGMATMVGKDEYAKMMGDSMKNMPKEMDMKNKRSYTFLSDNLAVVINDVTMTMGGKKIAMKNMSLATKKDGKWMVKEMVEGGWGDMMMNKGTGGGSTMDTTGTTPPANNNMGNGMNNNGQMKH